MMSPCPKFSPQERPSRPLFGIRFSPTTTQELVKAITTVPANAGPRILVTANLDHIVQLSQNEDFRRAYRRAWAATADGMPEIMYAKLKRAGLPARVTGADLFQAVIAALSPDRHRCFFVASTAETARRLVDYLLARGFKREAIAIAVPPFRFDDDEDFSRALAHRIARHGTTHLFMGVGAPKSEIWTDRYRDSIGNCYVLNCGAALDFSAGTKKRAPLVMRRAGLVWLWRFALEPQRLYRRYFVYSWRFLGEVAKDLAAAR
jgi:N-acetylglucosaminyldiphosphoundecaprenol N-acetyl-beta-D-mannosaminyltransferase